MTSELAAISPLDGRYHKKIGNLSEYFSEAALIRYRARAEIEYLIALSQEKTVPVELSEKEKQSLKRVYEEFSLEDAARAKEIEKKINHDVKSVEYLVKEKIEVMGLARVKEYVHFGLTSEDVSNIALSLMIKDALDNEFLPALVALEEKLLAMAGEHKSLAMLGRTHGQPASPTTLGKELAVFAYRIAKGLETISSARLPGKMNGATGNYNAHKTAFKEVDWIKFSELFVQGLGLEPWVCTTQILPHEDISSLFRAIEGINNVVLDLCLDCWRYISDGWFKQKVVEGEVGSSTMPHKVNPIDFENAEGNLQVSNSLFNALASILQTSRLQRDLSDSTVKRYYGNAFGSALLAYKNALKGLEKVIPDDKLITRELEEKPEVLAEAIQTVLRKEGVENPYEKLKQLTRGKQVTLKSLREFVERLELGAEAKKGLLELKPSTYTGEAVRITEKTIRECEKVLKKTRL